MKLPKIGIQKITKESVLDLERLDIISFNRLNSQLNEIGRLSSEDQKLNGILTSLTNLIDKNYIIYCLMDENALIGILKIGAKNLYLYDKDVMHYLNCLCVLDFYISRTFQRKGLGIKLFNYMLKDNDICPNELCYDNPSTKLQHFLKKYFARQDLIKQPNNYVIFPEFFTEVFRKQKNKCSIIRNTKEELSTMMWKGKKFHFTTKT